MKRFIIIETYIKNQSIKYNKQIIISTDNIRKIEPVIDEITNTNFLIITLINGEQFYIKNHDLKYLVHQLNKKYETTNNGSY